jgi:hypothetical protein
LRHQIRLSHAVQGQVHVGDSASHHPGHVVNALPADHQIDNLLVALGVIGSRDGKMVHRRRHFGSK